MVFEIILILLALTPVVVLGSLIDLSFLEEDARRSMKVNAHAGKLSKNRNFSQGDGGEGGSDSSVESAAGLSSGSVALIPPQI
jgi:hypothetical protein